MNSITIESHALFNPRRTACGPAYIPALAKCSRNVIADTNFLLLAIGVWFHGSKSKDLREWPFLILKNSHNQNFILHLER